MPSRLRGVLYRTVDLVADTWYAAGQAGRGTLRAAH
jgi:hypothetical protein